MSFRIGRALPGDRPDSGEDAEPDDDPGLTATIAASELDLRPFVGGLLILVGGVLGVPVLVMFGVVILVIAFARWLWLTFCAGSVGAEARAGLVEVATSLPRHHRNGRLPLSWLGQERCRRAQPVAHRVRVARPAADPGQRLDADRA
jgi:hypothetical protein